MVAVWSSRADNALSEGRRAAFLVYRRREEPLWPSRPPLGIENFHGPSRQRAEAADQLRILQTIITVRGITNMTTGREQRCSRAMLVLVVEFRCAMQREQWVEATGEGVAVRPISASRLSRAVVT